MNPMQPEKNVANGPVCWREQHRLVALVSEAVNYATDDRGLLQHHIATNTDVLQGDRLAACLLLRFATGEKQRFIFNKML